MRTEIDRWAELSYAKNKGKAEGIAQGRAEGKAEGKAEGIAVGKAEGRAEGKAEAASAMLADGMSPALVSKYTGLSEEQIAAVLDINVKGTYRKVTVTVTADKGGDAAIPYLCAFYSQHDLPSPRPAAP